MQVKHKMKARFITKKKRLMQERMAAHQVHISSDSCSCPEFFRSGTCMEQNFLHLHLTNLDGEDGRINLGYLKSKKKTESNIQLTIQFISVPRGSYSKKAHCVSSVSEIPENLCRLKSSIRKHKYGF